MLESIRENSQGKIAKIILGFVILTFAIAGVGSYTNSVDTSVAVVNGEKISRQAFNQAYQAQRNRMQQQFGEMFDQLAANPTYMANLRQSVLDNLIEERLVNQAANNLALRVSDERLKKTIVSMPEFQVDGKFDNNRYLALINQAGFIQSSDFRDYLRTEMIRRQLTQAVAASEFALPYQAELASKVRNQKRSIEYALINAKQFESQVTITEQQIEEYYQANQARFETPEQAKVDYILLDINDIKKSLAVTDEEIQNYYRDNIAQYTQAEQRRVSHILIEFGDDEAAAEQKAKDILAQINQGADFAELAKKESADTFSGENGGDLDYIERGTMDEAFDKAAFALAKVGDVSDVVKTSFGYHIIKLTDLKPEQVKALADVKDKITEKVLTEKAQDKFYELQQQLSQVSFESPDNLEAAAKAVNAEIKTSPWLKRNGNVVPFNEPAAIDAVFSDTVLQENANSDVVELNNNQALVVHLNEYQAAKVKPLEQVKAQINAILMRQQASELALAKVTELVEKFAKGEDIEEALVALHSKLESKSDITRFATDIDRAIIQQAFVLPHPTEDKRSVGQAKLANGDYALVRVTQVTEANAEVDPQLAQQQAQQLAQAAYKRYIETLKANAKIERRNLQDVDNS